MTYTRTVREMRSRVLTREFFDVHGTTNTHTFDPVYQTEVWNANGTRTGESVPKWRDKIKKAQNASSFYSRDSVKVMSWDSGYQSTSLSDFGKPKAGTLVESFVGMESAAIPGTISSAAMDTAHVDNEALKRVYRRIREERQQINGLQFIGELREALHMIRHPADSLIKGIKGYDALLRKRKRGIRPNIPSDKKRKIWTDIVSGTWLEVSFGWKPFLSDIDDIAHTAARFIGPDKHRSRAVGRFEDSTADSTFTPARKIGTYNYTKVLRRTATEYGRSYIVGLNVDLLGPDGSLARLRELSGFSLENFVPTAWELLPYSFLVDYFTNVGDVLEATCTATSNVTFIVLTTRTKDEVEVTLTPYFPPQVMDGVGYKVTGVSGSGLGHTHVVRTRLSRTPLGTLPIPSFEINLPDFGGYGKKYWNMTALLAGFRNDHKSIRF